jgi:hypothetical protein
MAAHDTDGLRLLLFEVYTRWSLGFRLEFTAVVQIFTDAVQQAPRRVSRMSSVRCKAPRRSFVRLPDSGVGVGFTSNARARALLRR